jgi:hypothetical protein
MSDDYRFDRECRTPYSEAYSIVKEEEQVGRVDLHYTSGVIYATLNVNETIDLETIQDLIELIDEELVMSADVFREDFIVTVHQGKEIGIFSDEDDDENEEDDVEGPN